MNKTQVSMLCVAAGVAAFAIWQRLTESDRPRDDRGQVIFSNTPHPSER
jgi:hypothetical protein